MEDKPKIKEIGKIRKYLFSAIRIYLVVVLAAFFLKDMILFQPSRVVDQTPSAIGLEYEAVSIETSDGITLSGWFVPAKNARATALFFHGNAGNISDRLSTLNILHNLGLSTLIIDYRGYGESGGRAGISGVKRDAVAAWEWLLKRGYPEENIILFGRSLGGAVAANLAGTVTPGALILESTFSSLADIGHGLVPFLPMSIIVGNSFNSVKNLKNFTRPVLVIHSRDDDVVAFKYGRKLYESLSAPKEFLEISGDHNNGFIISKNYIKGLDQFITGIFGEKQEALKGLLAIQTSYIF